MSEPLFSAGPWEAKTWEGSVVGHATGQAYEGEHAAVFSEAAGMICPLGLAADQESRANAHLIAAAPDLYEALTDLVKLIDEVAPSYADSTVVFAARAALSKAEGQQ